MNGLILNALPISTAATGSLVSAVWEGALLAAVVLLVLRMFPRLSAAARSVVWLNVFVLLALLHVLPAFTTSGATVHASSMHGMRVDPRWSLLVAALWILFSLFRVGQMVTGAIHLRRIARNAEPVPASPEIEPLLLHNRARVELCVSNDVARPSVLGFFRPRILVPPALMEELSDAELRQVVLHEMEHLRRGDDWINLLQKLALVLFPLNPALLWVERRLCAERELACDDRVLHAGSGRKAYALCLTHLAEFALVQRSFSLVLGAWERRPELVRRVHRILSGPAHSMGRRPALAAMGGVTTGALVCTLVLAHAPQLVRFAPVSHMDGQTPAAMASVDAQAVDARELSREMGGKPQMVKAVMPAPAHRSEPAIRAAVHHRTAHRTPPPARLADLRRADAGATAPAPPTMVVMTTAWMDDVSRTRVIVTFARTEHESRVTHSGANQPRPGMTPAAYAVVPTLDGWLVIQI